MVLIAQGKFMSFDSLRDQGQPMKNSDLKSYTEICYYAERFTFIETSMGSGSCRDDRRQKHAQRGLGRVVSIITTPRNYSLLGSNYA
jgi:hypothetical protein